MLICKCMVKVKICLHVKSGHGMKPIVLPTAYIDSRKSSWLIPRLMYKPVQIKQKNYQPYEVVILQRHL